jgi:hypothetical protein
VGIPSCYGGDIELQGMGRKTVLIVQRGDEVTRVLDPGLAQRHLLTQPGTDCTISSLAKQVVSKLELVDGVKFSGVGAAVSSLHKRFAPDDKKVLKDLRALNDAFALVRHVTSLGVSEWLQRLDEAVARLQPASRPAQQGKNGKASREQVAPIISAMDTDEAHCKPRRRRRRRGVAATSDIEVLASELGDEWADGARPATPSGQAPVTSCGGQATAAGAPARVLKQQTSRERSPRRAGGSVEAPNLDPARGGFQKGAKVCLQNLSMRKELIGVTGILGDFDAGSQRWAVALTSGSESVKVKSESIRLSIFQ